MQALKRIVWRLKEWWFWRHNKMFVVLTVLSLEGPMMESHLKRKMSAWIESDAEFESVVARLEDDRLISSSIRLFHNGSRVVRYRYEATVMGDIALNDWRIRNRYRFDRLLKLM